MTSPGRLASLVLAGALGLGGCGGSGAIEARRRAGDPGEVGRALASAATPSRGPVNRTGRPLAFLLVDEPAGSALVAVDVASGAALWRQTADVAGRVAVGRDVAVHSDRTGAIVARAVDTGAVVFRQEPPKGTSLVGYAADGDDVYVVRKLGSAEPRDRGAELGALDARGGTRFRIRMPAAIGAPAARGGLVAVPHQSQYVSLVDGRSGKVLADILSREQAAQFVTALPEGLFYGSRGVFLASADTAGGARSAPGYLEAKLPEFVRVVYHHDVYRPEQNAYSALDRNRILWRVDTAGGRPRFGGGQVVVHSFRFFFGMDAETGALRWAYSHPRIEAVTSAHVGDAVLFVTADGALGSLDARTGQRLSLRRVVNGPVRGATFDADGQRAEGPGAAPVQPLHQVLTAIVVDPDKRFSDPKVFALEELAKQQGPEVTADLLSILERSEGQPIIPQRATELLIARKDPAALDLYVESVKQHADYVEQRKVQRLDVLARALTGLGARKAVPELVEHLRLPDTDPAAVRDIADAVIETKANEAVEAFRDFLTQYRSDPAFVNEPGALIAACDVLLKLGGPSERALLLYVMEEPKTVSALRISLRRSLAQASGAGEAQP